MNFVTKSTLLSLPLILLVSAPFALSEGQQEEAPQHLTCLYEFYRGHYTCLIASANVTSSQLPLTITGVHLGLASSRDVKLIRTDKSMQGATSMRILHPQLFVEFPSAEELELHGVDLLELSLASCGSISRVSLLDLPLAQIPSLRGCGGLKSLEFWNLKDAALTADAFGGLSALEQLSIIRCPHISLLPASLADLTSLRTLGFQFNGAVDALALRGLRSLTAVAFSGASRDFRFFEELLGELANLTAIDLNENHFGGEINFGFFANFPRLERLGLAANGLTSVSGGAFGGLGSLKELALGRDNITALEHDSLYGLSGLERLWMAGGMLADLSTLPFSHLTNLREIYMHSNPIKALPAKLLENNAKIENFYAESCAIETVEEKVFDSLPALTSVYLSRNQISELKPGSFVNLTSLERLELSRNQVERLATAAFKNVPKLRTLSANFNRISRIEPNFFENLPSLMTFEAGENECISTSIGNVQSIDFEGANVLSECFENWTNGGATTTEGGGETSEETTPAGGGRVGAFGLFALATACFFAGVF